MPQTTAGFWGRLGLFRAPVLTAAHRLIGVAAVLGICFVVTHVISWIVTFAIAGFDVPIQAFLLDIAGFLASAVFAKVCRDASSSSSADHINENRWIWCAFVGVFLLPFAPPCMNGAWLIFGQIWRSFWAIVTIGSRAVDTLMLLGIVKWGDVYETPTGAILWCNLVSEVFFGNTYSAPLPCATHWRVSWRVSSLRRILPSRLTVRIALDLSSAL